MKQQKIIIEKAAKQLVKHIADKEAYGWPPLCSALYYQPIRPSKRIGTELNGEEGAEKTAVHNSGESLHCI